MDAQAELLVRVVSAKLKVGATGEQIREHALLMCNVLHSCAPATRPGLAGYGCVTDAAFGLLRLCVTALD